MGSLKRLQEGHYGYSPPKRFGFLPSVVLPSHTSSDTLDRSCHFGVQEGDTCCAHSILLEPLLSFVSQSETKVVQLKLLKNIGTRGRGSNRVSFRRAGNGYPNKAQLCSSVDCRVGN